jgi:cell division septation protein DedD
MEKNKEFRELQFSSTQLVFVFLAILVLGVFIFLLGVSVGKKQVQLSAEAGGPGQLKAEKVAEKPTQPAEPGAGEIQKELQSHQQAKQEEAKTEVKQAAGGQKPAVKPEAPAAKGKTGEAKPLTETKKASETKAKPETEKPAVKAAESKKGAQFYIQVGALGDRDAASTYAKKLEKEGFPALALDPLPVDKKAVFRVRVGPYESKEEADVVRTKLAAALKKKATDFFLVR